MSICGAVWRINWGDAPTWLAAIFAFAAGVVAYLLYLREAERDKRAAELQRQRDDEALKWQASRCAAWYGWKSAQPSGSNRTLAGSILGSGWGVFLANGSPVPIYDVRVDFYYSSPEINSGDPLGPLSYLPLRVLPPGEHFRLAPEGTLEDFPAGERENFLVAMYFRDSTNRVWRREITGELELVGWAVDVEVTA